MLAFANAQVVAQICNLLYRRIAFCGAFAKAEQSLRS